MSYVDHGRVQAALKDLPTERVDQLVLDIEALVNAVVEGATGRLDHALFVTQLLRRLFAGVKDAPLPRACPERSRRETP